MASQFMYHTDVQPVDEGGKVLKPLDLVLIGDIPEYYWNETETESLKAYEGTIGLVNYEERESAYCNPYRVDKTYYPGWVNNDGDFVQVDTRRHDQENDCILSFGFWLPAKNLKKIPYNSLIMNIFVEYPWQMGEEDGPSTYHFIRKGVPEYDYLAMILDMPYERLQRAHEAAMSVLKIDQT